MKNLFYCLPNNQKSALNNNFIIKKSKNHFLILFMSKFKTKTVKFFLVVLLFFPGFVFSESQLSIQTGNQNSASWQFTESFSEIWKQKFPDSGFGFTPEFINNSNDRFSNLEEKKCQFTIAPYKSIFGHLSMVSEVKIIAILWEVYLVPIEFSLHKQKIGTSNYQSWYIPEKSVIIPAVLDSSQVLFFSDSIVSTFSKNQGSLILTGEYVYPNPTGLANEVISFQDESDDVSNDYETGFLEEEIELADASTDDQREFEYLNIKEDESFETEWVENPRIEFEGIEFLKVKNINIKEVIETYTKGILFYEMMGPIRHLKKAFDKKLNIIEFQDDLKDLMTKTHPWLTEFELKRSRFKTISFKMVLYAHESEDAKFVEKILETLTKQPKTLFPRTYLLKNLAIQQTQKISPLLLHEGTLNFFNLN